MITCNFARFEYYVNLMNHRIQANFPRFYPAELSTRGIQPIWQIVVPRLNVELCLNLCSILRVYSCGSYVNNGQKLTRRFAPPFLPLRSIYPSFVHSALL